ncbi:Putative F-box protein At3g58860 [Linum grandiflorum]
MASDAVSALKMQMQVLENKALDSVCISQQGEQLELDLISELPDELVINILSRLTVAEAISTSVLSSRWIDLWKSVSVLDFDASEELLAIHKLKHEDSYRIIPKKRLWYKNWVNRVISQVQQSCSTLTKFRVSFNLTKKCNSEGDIDRWLEFAISKRVESLHLTLNAEQIAPRDYYVFSEECYNQIKTRVGMRVLRSLRLSYVKVRGEILEHFIANCPVLEELAVTRSFDLIKLKVVGSSHSPLPLKYLEVTDCLLLNSIEIDHTPHLERLILDGYLYRVEEIKVGDCPSLVDTTIGTSFICSKMLRALSGCAIRLLSLVLKVNKLDKPILDAAEQSNLLQLTVQAGISDWDSILGLIPLINVCPRLHTLQLLFNTRYTWARGRPSVDVVKVGRDSIKVVEVVGFRGYILEYEFME